MRQLSFSVDKIPMRKITALVQKEKKKKRKKKHNTFEVVAQSLPEPPFHSFLSIVEVGLVRVGRRKLLIPFSGS